MSITPLRLGLQIAPKQLGPIYILQASTEVYYMELWGTNSEDYPRPDIWQN